VRTDDANVNRHLKTSERKTLPQLFAIDWFDPLRFEEFIDLPKMFCESLIVVVPQHPTKHGCRYTQERFVVIIEWVWGFSDQNGDDLIVRSLNFFRLAQADLWFQVSKLFARDRSSPCCTVHTFAARSSGTSQ
jgi:hypothetical protein